MAFLERASARIHFQVSGKGPCVLLSHGFSATSQMWAEQAAALQDGYRVITWDMRGHGQTAGPEDPAGYSEAETVDDMAELLDMCGDERAVVGGLSLGGYMSLAFYLKYPERVQALMLFDTGPGYKNAEARAQWNERAEAWARALVSDGLNAMSTMGTDEMRPESHLSAQALAHAARGMLAQFDARVIESLPNINVPTLVLVGGDDTLFLPPAEYMAKKIPGAEKVVIPGAGHAANLHQPQAFNDAVLSFLKTLGS